MISKRLTAPPPPSEPPHALNEVERCGVARGLFAIWATLRAGADAPRLEDGEPKITHKVERAIRLELESSTGPWEVLGFCSVVRGGEVPNDEGSRIEKRPDLLLAQHPRRWPAFGEASGVFVECKVIQRPDFSVNLYVKKGVERFINGTYAWMMLDAFMMAYVFDGQQAEAALGHLEPTPLTDTGAVTTRHERPTVERAKRRPISLHHVWLAA